MRDRPVEEMSASQHSQQTGIHAPEPTISASDRPQTLAPDRSATGMATRLSAQIVSRRWIIQLNLSNVFSIATTLRASNPVRGKRFFSRWLWSQLSLLFNEYRVCILRVKWPRREVKHSPPSSAEVKNEWSCTFTFTHCLNRRNFYLFLPNLIKWRWCHSHHICSRIHDVVITDCRKLTKVQHWGGLHLVNSDVTFSERLSHGSKVGKMRTHATWRPWSYKPVKLS
jgi:hypothetical protein